MEIVNPFKQNATINEGTQIRLACVSRGGNPVPEIEWSIESMSNVTANTTHILMNTVESVLDFTITRDYHKRLIVCKSKNRVGTLSQNVSFNVTCNFDKNSNSHHQINFDNDLINEFYSRFTV